MIDDEVRAYFRAIWEKSNSCIPGSGDSMVSSFVFLRFLCPGFASPKLFGVIDFDLTTNETRGMLLLMKVLQSILNNVQIKDPNLADMDQIREKHYPELMEDVKNLVSINPIGPPKKKKRTLFESITHSTASSPRTKTFDFEVTPQQVEEAGICLSKYICDYSPQVCHALGDPNLQQALENLVEAITERSELSDATELTDLSEVSNDWSLDLDDI